MDVYAADMKSYQRLVLDGKYLDRTLFDNLTSAECLSRYKANFLTSGNCFGVPTPDYQARLNLNASLHAYSMFLLEGSYSNLELSGANYSCRPKTP